MNLPNYKEAKKRNKDYQTIKYQENINIKGKYKGKTYSNVIDPTTGYTAENMVGVTVITDDSSDAEVLSYILFFMTIPEGQEFIKAYEDTEVMWAYVNSENQKKKVITEDFYNIK